MKGPMTYSVYQGNTSAINLNVSEALSVTKEIQDINFKNGIDPYHGFKIEMHTPRGSILASGMNAWSELSTYLKGPQ